jgi:septal ring factor EnvC (AmiA/AmiB activator)
MTDAELIKWARARADRMISVDRDMVTLLANRIKALTEQLAVARQDAKAAEDELELQEQEACMMENDYIKLEKERDALDAKLAKAVEVAEKLRNDFRSYKFNSMGDFYDPGKDPQFAAFDATLAKIKGEKP